MKRFDSARNNWHAYRDGERTSMEGDEVFAKLAHARTRGLLEAAGDRSTIATLLKSAYMQGFEDCFVAANPALEPKA